MYSWDDLESAANEIADWIIDQVSWSGSLDQATAVAYTRWRFGDALVTHDASGTIVLDHYVVEAVRLLGAGRIIWEGEARRWRRRAWYETPERHAA